MTTPRIDLKETAAKQYAAMVALDRSIELDPRLRELVKLRASQLNGCAFCIDMHWRDARADGESEERLYMLAVWRESALYDARERAALALCEAITRLGEDDVSDEVWHSAAEHFGSAELAQLVFAIAAINALNRLAIATRQQPARTQLVDASVSRRMEVHDEAPERRAHRPTLADS